MNFNEKYDNKPSAQLVRIINLKKGEEREYIEQLLLSRGHIKNEKGKWILQSVEVREDKINQVIKDPSTPKTPEDLRDENDPSADESPCIPEVKESEDEKIKTLKEKVFGKDSVTDEMIEKAKLNIGKGIIWMHKGEQKLGVIKSVNVRQKNGKTYAQYMIQIQGEKGLKGKTITQYDIQIVDKNKTDLL